MLVGNINVSNNDDDNGDDNRLERKNESYCWSCGEFYAWKRNQPEVSTACEGF